MGDRAIYEKPEPIFCDVLNIPKVSLSPAAMATDMPGWNGVAA